MDKLKSLRFYKFFTKKIKTSKIFWEIRALYSSLEIMISFVDYGIKQSKRVYKRRKAEAFNSNKEEIKLSYEEKDYLKGYDSMINFKRAHYLEKAMYCETPRNKNLDLIHTNLSHYLKSKNGKDDDCFSYLEKLRKEYDKYPNNFKCFMLKIEKSKWDSEDKKIIEKVIKKRRSIRSFGKKTIPIEKFKKILMAGSYAPSSCNAQPVHFLTKTDNYLVEEILKSASGVSEFQKNIPNVI